MKKGVRLPNFTTAQVIEINTLKQVKASIDQETGPSERSSHSKNQNGKTKLTIRYLYNDSMT